jgi:uncharacterized protein (DUF1501 family)
MAASDPSESEAARADRAMAALIEDLVEGGLYEDTAVVGGEFGRTPRINGAGRDHRRS